MEQQRFVDHLNEQRRVPVGDDYRWLADYEEEPVEIETDKLPFSPTGQARQAYVDDEINEDELERRIGHDIMLEMEDTMQTKSPDSVF